MFDNVICKKKLPLTKEIKKAFSNTDWTKVGFQTKDLDNTLSTYLIKGTSLYVEEVKGEYVRTMSEEEAEKARKKNRWVWPYKFEEKSRKTVKLSHHGVVNFYIYEDDKEGNTWDIEFDAVFSKGVLKSIKLVKGEITHTAEENAALEKQWADRQDAYERHPWTKTKKVLNKVTFGYWSKFWGNNVSRALHWFGTKVQKLQLWVVRTLA